MIRRLIEQEICRLWSKSCVALKSPPTAPVDRDVYLVIDDFGALGTVFLETNINKTDEKTVIADMLSGPFNSPVRVVAFNIAEGWARDCRPTLPGRSPTRCVTKTTWPAGHAGVCRAAARRAVEQPSV